MAEEAKHVIHNGDSGERRVKVSVLRLWQFLTLALGILLLAGIATSGFKLNGSGGLSGEQVSKKAAGYINDNLLQGQATASVKDVKESNGLYLLKIDIGGQLLDVYATKDGVILFPQMINMDEVQGEGVPEGSVSETAASVKLETGEAPVKGSKDAPVVIMEFSDLSCPFCGAAAGKNKEAIDYLRSRDSSWEAPLPRIFEDYVKAGKVRFAFKYFPGHGTGEGAMKLAWCADEQGLFWEVHDAFFENQDSIENVDRLKEIAVAAGVDRPKMEECYESGRYDSRLASDANEGRAAGVSGTPTFFINGVRVSGAQSFPALKQIIEAELSG